MATMELTRTTDDEDEVGEEELEEGAAEDELSHADTDEDTTAEGTRECCGCCSCKSSPPVVFTLQTGIRHVIDDNVVLGCFLKFRTSPSCIARFLLLALFLMTAVFVQYAEEGVGPICIREYLSVCPPFKTVANHLTFTYLEQSPPSIIVPDDITLISEPLENTSASEDGSGTLLLIEKEKSYPEVVRDDMLKKMSYMFRSWRFDCDKPMCDIFYPQMIDWLSLFRLTNSIWGSSNSYNIPVTSDAVILGYCKCEGPVYDGIVDAKVTGEARTIAITLIFQTLLAGIFRGVFKCISGARERNPKSTCLFTCNSVTVVLLLAVVATMAATVFLLKFDPVGWKKALELSALNAAFLDPIMSLVQILFCIKVAWPLRLCGLGPPSEPVSKYPVICGYRFDSASRSESDESASADDADELT